MLYDLEHLKQLAQRNMAIAEENLRKDGFVQACGLIWTYEGLSKIIPMRFESLDEKRRTQEAFRSLLRQSDALAAAVIMEAWIKKFGPTEAADFRGSVENIPGRQDAIVIELRSSVASYILVQAFYRKGLVLTMKEATEMSVSHYWESEWFADIWMEREISGKSTIPNAS